MMNEYFCKNNDTDLSRLSNEFKRWRFSHFNQNKENNISVFCCQVQSTDDLKKEWQQINNYIATTFVFKNKNAFERWNTYLLFSCSEVTPPALHYEIENNKFALRKILIAGKSLDNYELVDFLNQKILATNIEINQTSKYAVEIKDLSLISSRLLAGKWNINDSKKFTQERKEWLDAELVRMTSNEN